MQRMDGSLDGWNKEGKYSSADTNSNSSEILEVNFQGPKNTKDWRNSICRIEETSENVILSLRWMRQ